MESMTVNRAEYDAKTGEREPHHVPQDSNFLKSDEKFNGETHFTREFQRKTGERAEIRKPEISDIWKVRFTNNSIMNLRIGFRKSIFCQRSQIFFLSAPFLVIIYSILINDRVFS